MIKVPAYGPTDARIAIVGESPGAQEVKKGRPFVGKSGERLAEWLRAAGIQKEDCYLTNACKYRPVGDKEKWFFNDKKHTTPTPIYIEGIGELYKELTSVKPNVVFALGNYALWALTQQWGILKWRGSILESTTVPGLKVVPGLHPAFIMRGMWTHRSLFIWDAKRVKKQSAFPEIKRPDRTWVSNPSDIEILQAVERLSSVEPLTCDTEWYTPDLPSCTGFADSPEWAICIPSDSPMAVQSYNEILDTDMVNVYQNAMFDVVQLRRAGIKVRIRHSETGDLLVRDTMVAHRVCWPDLKKDLGIIGSIFTEEPYYKEDFKIWGKTGERDTLYVYNCKDNTTTHEAWLGLEKEMKDMGTRRAYDLNMLPFEALCESAIVGMRCDHLRLKSLIEEVDDNTNELQGLLDGIVGHKINVRSPKQVKTFLARLGAPKRASTNQMTLMDITAQSRDQTLRTLLTVIIKIRQNRKLRSSYIREQLPDTDGRLRWTWDMAGTKNGRRSAKADSFRKRGASPQTIPNRARELYVADPGCTLVGYDFEQAEARVMAYKSEDWRMIDWFDEGLDIHRKVAEFLFKIPYDEIGKDSRERFLGKQSRHATNYGEGPVMLKLAVNKFWLETGIGITQGQAKGLINGIHDMSPSIQLYWDWVQSELSRNGAIVNPFGRRRRFTDIWGSTLFKDAYAFYPQSAIADLNAIVTHRIYEAWRHVGLLYFIDLHDGGLMQVPDEHVDEVVESMPELLTVPMQIDAHEIVIPFEIKTGPNWKHMEEAA